MHRLSAQSFIALTLATHLSVLSSASRSIGMALANGNINIDKTRTPGNAPLFDGNTVETDKASSRLQLNNGVRVVLASDSKGTIYRDRLILEKGSTQVDIHGTYGVSAKFLRIGGTEPNYSARVSLLGARVQVASLNGTLQVADARGVMLTRIAPGMAFDFTPQEAGATAATGANKRKKKPSSQVILKDSAAPGIGGHGTAIMAGIIIAAAVGTTVGVLATNGASQPEQGISPSRP